MPSSSSAVLLPPMVSPASCLSSECGSALSEASPPAPVPRMEAALAEIARQQRELALAVERVQKDLDGLSLRLFEGGHAASPARRCGAASRWARGVSPQGERDRHRCDSEASEHHAHAAAAAAASPGGGRRSRRPSEVSELVAAAPVGGRRRRPSEASLFTLSQGSLTLADLAGAGPGGARSLQDCEMDCASENEADCDGFVAPSLPISWPQVLEVREGLYAVSHTPRRKRRQTSAGGTMSLDISTQALRSRGNSSLIMYLRNPSSLTNLFWDMVGLSILMYDMTVVPYLLSWEIAMHGVYEAAATFSAAYWTCSILLSFCRGFYRHGQVVYAYEVIARHYLRTWFLPDVLLVIIDWLSLPAFATARDESAPGFKLVRLVKIGKVARVLAFLKVVRFAKLMKVASSLMQGSEFADHFRAGSRILVIFLTTLWANHILSCMWYVVGKSAPSDTGSRWVDSPAADLADDSEFAEASNLYQYATALHWAIAQSTLGAMEISARNSAERLYTILCLMLGLVCGSTLISQLSATLVEFQMVAQEKNNQLRALRRYLQQNGVSNNTSSAVQRQAQERWGQTERLTKADVPVLRLLSRDLHQALHAEVCVPHLMRHPFFRVLCMLDGTWFPRFCAKAVDISIRRSGDDIFIAGADAVAAYFVVNGNVSYSQEPQTSPVFGHITMELSNDTWLCESALWSHWIHVGCAKATSSCQLIEISAHACFRTLTGHSAIGDLANEYCHAFHSRIVTAKPPQASYPSDVEVPFTECGDLVYMMRRELRVSVAVMASEAIERKGLAGFRSGHTKQAEELISEVSEGKSVLVFNGAGEAERVLALAVLNLTRDDGCVFAQLGTWDGAGASADCQLPAAKRMENETTEDSLQRLLSTKLPALVDCLDLTHVEQQVTKKASKKYGIYTKYLRRVCFATLSRPFQAAACLAGRRHRDETLVDHVASSSTQASGPMEVADSVPERFLLHPAYFFGTEAKGVFYSWLDEAAFQHLSSAAGEGEISAWVQALRPPPTTAPPSQSPEDGPNDFMTTEVSI